MFGLFDVMRTLTLIAIFIVSVAFGADPNPRELMAAAGFGRYRAKSSRTMSDLRELIEQAGVSSGPAPERRGLVICRGPEERSLGRTEEPKAQAAGKRKNRVLAGSFLLEKRLKGTESAHEGSE